MEEAHQRLDLLRRSQHLGHPGDWLDEALLCLCQRNLHHGVDEGHGFRDHVLGHVHDQRAYGDPHPHHRLPHLHSLVHSSHQLAQAYGQAEQKPCAQGFLVRKAP